MTPTDVVGEVYCTLTREGTFFELDTLVIRQPDVDISGANPFMVRNDIAVCPADRQFVIGGSNFVLYGRLYRHTFQPSAQRIQGFLLH